MEAPLPATQLTVRELPPNIFAVVMATGIVSLAAHNAGLHWLGQILFWLNVVLYIALAGLLGLRLAHFRREAVEDLKSHARSPGFFTLVAAPCVLGNQFVLLAGEYAAGATLWTIALVFWLMLSYLMLPGLMHGASKPPPETGLSGAWLLTVVGTQAISVLACALLPAFAEWMLHVLLFAALCFWLIGSMLYIWIIALIFHRIVFLPLPAKELTPPYWINMGAMAISTLAGVKLIEQVELMPMLVELSPFIKGMTLLFWATATWWIPALLSLGAWRHVAGRVPLSYDHSYWAAVFPLGMYTACTQNLARVFELPFLRLIPAVFVWIALGAWAVTFVGFVRSALRR